MATEEKTESAVTAEKIRESVKTAKTRKVKKPVKTERVTIDGYTLSLCKAGKYTESQIKSLVCKKFPTKDKDILSHTTHRRLHGYFVREKNIPLVKDDNGIYSVKKSKSKKSTK